MTAETFLHRWLANGARCWYTRDWPVGLLDLVHQRADGWKQRMRPEVVWLGVSPRRLYRQTVMPIYRHAN